MAKKKKLPLRAARVPINSQGYDGRGRYWGTGEPLFHVTHYGEDLHIDTHVRAASAKAAKAFVHGELEREENSRWRQLTGAPVRGRWL